MDFSGIMAQIAKRSAQREQPGDYRVDGLLYCGKCRTPKECRITIGGQAMQVGCMCRCQSDDWNREQQEERRRKAAVRVKQLRAECIQDRKLDGCRFEEADDSKNIRRCRRYVENWDRVRREGAGMVLYGPPGGGKTFAAACIANALLDKGVPVMVTSFPKILAASFDERAEIINQLGRYSLLVLDDLGVERDSPYALEQVYTVIDERIKAGRPMIVTTNLALGDLQNPRDMERSRIYSRILSKSAPVFFPQAEYRERAGAHQVSVLKEIFGGG